MTSSSRLLAVGALSLAAVLAAGCQSYDKPNTPLPDSFSAVRLDGVRVDRESLRGKPWVINVWMVG